MELESPDSLARQSPSDFREERELGPITVVVSIAIGWKRWWSAKYRCFSRFRSSALAATSPAVAVAWLVYEVANISGQAASRTSGRPDFHFKR